MQRIGRRTRRARREPRCRVQQLGHRDLAFTQPAKELRRIIGLQFVGECGDVLEGDAESRQLAFDEGATGRFVFTGIDSSEPAAQLGATARRGEKALLNQPIATR